jgi:hypothetical protein
VAKKPTRRKLDEIASPQEQTAWLQSPLNDGVTPLRAAPIMADDPYDDRLRLLLGAPEWLAFAAFLRAYIENAIFEPFKTEPSETQRGWWNLTIGDRGSSARINVWRQYVLVIHFRAISESDSLNAHGWVWVDRETLEEAIGSGYRLQPCFEIVETRLKGNTRPQISIKIKAAPIEILDDLFNSDWMLAATRTLNLDLMRGGQLAFNWPQYHVRKLVDAIFAEDFSQNGQRSQQATEASDRLLEIGETQRETTALARIGQDRFADEVREYWHGKCAVTGIECAALLQACHIKPFNECEDTTAERGDKYNGLYLAAHIHVAFDADLIGFSPSGDLCVSERLSAEDRRRIGLRDGMRIAIGERHRPYLEYRYAKFQKANMR